MVIHVEPSEQFLIDVAALTLMLGSDAEFVIRAMNDALQKLKASGWGRELDIRQTGGNEFAYAVHELYEVKFLIRDQRPSFAPTEEMWLQMLTLQLRKLDTPGGR